jgi:hypothetical protein
MRYSLLLMSFITILSVCAQTEADSVMLLDGKTFRGSVVELTDDFLAFKLKSTVSKKKEQITNIDKYRIFSYYQNGEEVVLYKQTDSPENFLTIDQARSAALGSYDAKNHYNVKPVFYSSAAVTLGFCLADTYLTTKNKNLLGNPELKTGFLGRSPSIWPIASILVLPIGFGIPSTKVRTKNLMNGIRGDQYYYAGFNSTARQRRSFEALKGAATGLVLGYATFFLFHTNAY